ncbi:hypothetical protein [Brevibacterium antiquum]|uniref:hypothetical protein n=1 Tax=Brevibacterium antiquum TaxID=234835 RepID=UPI0015E12C7D|nr:hypothetical protein [Brevibacterium antiquum]
MTGNRSTQLSSIREPSSGVGSFASGGGALRRQLLELPDVDGADEVHQMPEIDERTVDP